MCDFQTDVFLVETGQLGGDAYLFVRFINVDLGPIQCPGWPKRCKIKSAKHVVEHAIHFAMQRKEWMDVSTAVDADVATPVVPGNEVLDSHAVFSLKRLPPRSGPPWKSVADENVALRSGYSFAIDLMDVRSGRARDRNTTRLHGLRDLAHQFDLQQAVVEDGSFDLDIVR
jgi:hypothetical protein